MQSKDLRRWHARVESVESVDDELALDGKLLKALMLSEIHQVPFSVLYNYRKEEEIKGLHPAGDALISG